MMKYTILIFSNLYKYINVENMRAKQSMQTLWIKNSRMRPMWAFVLLLPRVSMFARSVPVPVSVYVTTCFI